MSRFFLKTAAAGCVVTALTLAGGTTSTQAQAVDDSAAPVQETRDAEMDWGWLGLLGLAGLLGLMRRDRHHADYHEPATTARATTRP